MRQYSVVVNGRTYSVEVGRLRKGRPVFFKVNDTPRQVELSTEMKYGGPFTVKVDDRSYDVELERIEDTSPFPVKVNQVILNIELRPAALGKAPRLLQPYRPGYERKAAEEVEEGTIVAPMTGRVLAVRVKEGDTVKPGSVVCVLEAMKMENEIKCPRGGLVRRVRVSEGMTVNKGDPLVTVS